MWLFHFRQASAGSESPDRSEQSPDSAISFHSAGQYQQDLIIRNLQKQLLQERQERERAQKLLLEKEELFRKQLAEKEKEKENIIAENEFHVQKAQRLEADVRESQKKRAMMTIKLTATRQKLRRQAEPKKPAGVFELEPDNAVPLSISELGSTRLGMEMVATTESISQENEILQEPNAKGDGRRGPKKSRLMPV